MLLKDEVQMLRRVPLLQGASPAGLKLLAFTSDRVNYAPGETLFWQGDQGDAAYVILTGRADILISSGGTEIKVAEVGANSLVGEISILCDVPRTASVRAVTDLQTLRIQKEQFLKLMQDFPEMMVQVIRVLADRLYKTTLELGEERSHHPQPGHI
ncbi:cyclic nucleotide-binding domain-containing protein [Thioclava sp. BHET1]|nr:cyclic nucleotide-binding domain-containing protein [Thioclava sp. BHET1]